MSFQAKNVLITGGAGFIGSNHVRWLLTNNSDVNIVNLDAMTYAGNIENLNNLPDPNRHTFVKGDICDRALIDKLLRDYTIDNIIHFAAESHVDRSISGPAAFVQTNVVGTFTLLEAARIYWLQENPGMNCHFHHISTDEVYGTLEKTDPPFTETNPYYPNSPYSASKAASDHLVRSYFHTYGLPVTTSNCSNNYGPFQHPEKLIPTVIRTCLAEQPIPVYGDGTNIRDWLFVEDHCIAADRIIREGKLGEVYNVGGCNEWANIDIVRLICKTLDKLKPCKIGTHEELITFVTDRPGHDWRYAIDNKKIHTELNWTPSLQFEEGIQKTIEWYLNDIDK